MVCQHTKRSLRAIAMNTRERGFCQEKWSDFNTSTTRILDKNNPKKDASETLFGHKAYPYDTKVNDFAPLEHADWRAKACH